MGKAAVLQIAQDILLSQGDTDFLDAAYREVLEDVSVRQQAWVRWQVVVGKAGRQEYTITGDSQAGSEILAVIYYPTELFPTDPWALDIADVDWRKATGTPRYWMREVASPLSFRVVPISVVDGAEGIPWFFNLPGEVEPVNDCVVVYTAIPQEEDLYPWQEALLAYWLAAREAQRLSEGRDVPLANTLQELAAVLERVILQDEFMAQQT